MRVAIVGGGMGGLTAGRILHRAGCEVTVYEKSDGIGGRVRSDRFRGFTLDRGFQVFFDAYPAARRQLDYTDLNLRSFEPGAIISFAATRNILSDPLRDFPALPAAVRTNIVSLEDKLRTALLSAELKNRPTRAIMRDKDQTTEAYLLHRGFSGAYIERFVRPFFGGIFLDRSLQTSAKAFQFDWKMLAAGNTVVPASGMGAISAQLGRELVAADRIRLETPIRELIRESDGGVGGVRTDDGEICHADAVVVATPAPEAVRLTGMKMPEGSVGTTCLYFTGPTSVYDEKKVVLHANPDAFVNNVIQLDNAAPEYAPPGAHLLSVTVLGTPEGDDSSLYERALRDLRRMWAGDRRALDAISRLSPLALYRIPYAQFAQPVGVYDGLPDSITATPGLFFAGEFTAASSLNAAIASGEACAKEILKRDG
ncbi:MAG: FAD-dependent oxidoreductase [Akkermansiaceae bacterium]|nr:FAD-dependent oxidoreductase [Armatimonadota bacterium]